MIFETFTKNVVCEKLQRFKDFQTESKVIVRN